MTKVNFTIDAAPFVNLKGANFSGLTRHAEISVNDTETWGKGLTPLFSQLVQSMFKGIAKGQPIQWAMSVINDSGSVLVEGSEVMKVIAFPLRRLFSRLFGYNSLPK